MPAGSEEQQLQRSDQESAAERLRRRQEKQVGASRVLASAEAACDAIPGLVDG